MITMKKISDNAIAANNFRNYSDAAAINYWATYSEELLSAERVILEKIRPEIKGKKILDLGVGGGRTTAALLDISQDYLGVDYSQGMIDVCRKKFPKVNFLQGDAREISAIVQRGFSLVMFSLNGIDYVTHSDRQRIYTELTKVMSPSGYFLFSSHNLRDYPVKPWQSLPIDYESFRSFARSLYHILKNNLSYIHLCRDQVVHDGYAMLLDPGQGYRLLSYYIDPDEQIAQLHRNGFVDAKAFDRWGKEMIGNSGQCDHVNPVHYLARLRA